MFALDPRGVNMGRRLCAQVRKKRPIFPPCGAKTWGSGGAPPTTLILLRNQRPRRRRAATWSASSRRPRAHDDPPATARQALVVGGQVCELQKDLPSAESQEPPSSGARFTYGAAVRTCSGWRTPAGRSMPPSRVLTGLRESGVLADASPLSPRRTMMRLNRAMS